MVDGEVHHKTPAKFEVSNQVYLFHQRESCFEIQKKIEFFYCVLATALFNHKKKLGGYNGSYFFLSHL